MISGYALDALRRRVAGGPDVVVSSRLGSCCYVVHGADGDVLVDAGHPRSADDTIHALAARGALPRLRAVIATHRHADHVGAIARLQARGVEVWAAPHVPNPVLREQENRLDLKPAAFRVDRELQDNQRIDLGGETLRIVATPGHADDHIAVYMERAGMLLCGDLFTFEDIGTCDISRPHAESLELMERSIARCAALNPACVGPGHGAPVLDGRRLMSTASRRIQLFRQRPAMLIAHSLMPLMVFLIESRSGATIEAIRNEVSKHTPLLDRFVAGMMDLGGELDRILTVLAMRGAIQVADGRIYTAAGAPSAAA